MIARLSKLNSRATVWIRADLVVSPSLEAFQSLGVVARGGPSTGTLSRLNVLVKDIHTILVFVHWDTTLVA